MLDVPTVRRSRELEFAWIARSRIRMVIFDVMVASIMLECLLVVSIIAALLAVATLLAKIMSFAHFATVRSGSRRRRLHSSL